MEAGHRDEMKAMLVACSFMGGLGYCCPNPQKVKISAGSTVAGEHIASPETTIAVEDLKRPVIPCLPKSEKYVYSQSGQKRSRVATKGWKLLVRWADGSESWIPLKDLKASHPVETAEFAKARGIDAEVAFAWVPYTLRKRDVILAAVKGRIRRNHAQIRCRASSGCSTCNGTWPEEWKFVLA